MLTPFCLSSFANSPTRIVLFAVLVYELLGPVATKWALTKAGDIQPKSEEVLKRRERKLAAAGK